MLSLGLECLPRHATCCKCFQYPKSWASFHKLLSCSRRLTWEQLVGSPSTLCFFRTWEKMSAHHQKPGRLPRAGHMMLRVGTAFWVQEALPTTCPRLPPFLPGDSYPRKHQVIERVCTCVCICEHVHVCKSVCEHVNMCAPVCACVNVCVPVWACICVWVFWMLWCDNWLIDQ